MPTLLKYVLAFAFFALLVPAASAQDFIFLDQADLDFEVGVPGTSPPSNAAAVAKDSAPSFALRQVVAPFSEAILATGHDEHVFYIGCRVSAVAGA